MPQSLHEDTEPPPSEPSFKLRDSIKTRRHRRDIWEREGERSIGQNLAMVGMIGWLVVTPILAGIFLGHWLDSMLESGVFMTGTFLILGAVFGCSLAWKRLSQEQSK